MLGKLLACQINLSVYEPKWIVEQENVDSTIVCSFNIDTVSDAGYNTSLFYFFLMNHAKLTHAH
jgi:hypothetical protein